MGDSPLEIQHFGFWKTLDSVFGYIRLNNPDMIKFVRTFDGYVKARRKECRCHTHIYGTVFKFRSNSESVYLSVRVSV